MRDWLNKNKDRLFFVGVILFAFLSHAVNMFHYPYYENDEGTYMSQAWAILRRGELAPYTYWYDHAPFGWVIIFFWTMLTGGFFTFGTSVDSGRVLMLVIHVVESIILLFISKKLTKDYLAGVIAVVFFSLSPLAIYFQRRVLLDNIMAVLVLASMALLLVKKLKLVHVVISAFIFGMAILTKENAIFFYPAFLYLLYIKNHIYNKSFALVIWLAISVFVVSNYFLFAFLKKEFFPVGFMGDNTEHVSLLTTAKNQVSRGSNYPFWDTRSDFYFNLTEWYKKDSIIFIFGLISAFFVMLISIKNRLLRIITLFTLCFIFFLNRGKLVLDFYIIPLIPFLALNIGLFVDRLIQFRFLRPFVIRAVIVILVTGASLYSMTYYGYAPYIKDETTEQRAAARWIKENLPEDSHIVIDASIWVDLHEPGWINDKVFRNADWSWKVEQDKEIREAKLKDDWKNIEYIAVTHEMLKQIRLSPDDFLRNAFVNSDPVRIWDNGSTSYIDTSKLLSTNGDWMGLYKVKREEDVYLTLLWRDFKEKYIQEYGKVVDPANGTTTSEGQSYAMLRAVWMDDKKTFDGVWQWTKDHFQYRPDKLISWQWGPKDGKDQLLDSNNATDADTDIIMALIFASGRWKDPKYLSEAREMLPDFWEGNIVRIGGRYLVLSSSDSRNEEGNLVNPSYFSPAAYRIFARVDKTHDWNKVADDSYYYLNEIKKESGQPGLMPNWVFVSDTGKIGPADSVIGASAGEYGYDAFRTYFRVALDYLWFGNKDAYTFLADASPFFKSEWQKGANFRAVYTTDGVAVAGYNDIATVAGPFSIFNVTDINLAKNIYKGLYKTYMDEFKVGNNPEDYYDKNWVWFSLALYSNRTPNLASN